MTTAVESTPAVTTPAATPAATPAPSAPATPAASTETLLDSAPTTNTNGDGKTLLDGDSSDQAGQGTTDTSKDAKPGETKPAEGTEQKPQIAPEKYEEFKLPEGQALDSAKAEEFKALAKGLNLTQEQAQNLVDFQAKFAQGKQQEAIDGYKQQIADWKQETIQSLGPNHQKEIAIAVKALDRFGGSELKQLLKDTGLANHKAVIGFLNKIGKGVSEDTFAEGSNRATPKDPAELLYPSSS